MLSNMPLFESSRTSRVVTIALQYSGMFAVEFLEWLPDNLHIWEGFAENAINIKLRGYKHYSARTIVEFLRHHTALKQNSGGEWKINDHHVPYLARLFDIVYPQHAGLFEYRRTIKAKGAAQ